MTPPEFQRQLARLNEVFSNTYKTDRAQLIWREVSAFSEESFATVVDRLIGGCRQAPMLPEFREAVAAERERLWQVQKHTKKDEPWALNYRCDYCRDRGVYLCTVRGDRSRPYAFRCHCSVSENDQRRAIPQFKQVHKDEGYWFYDVG